MINHSIVLYISNLIQEHNKLYNIYWELRYKSKHNNKEYAKLIDKNSETNLQRQMNDIKTKIIVFKRKYNISDIDYSEMHQLASNNKLTVEKLKEYIK